MKKIEFSQEEINKIIELYNNNMTQKAIAEQFNVSRIVIKRVLTENEVKLRKLTTKYVSQTDIFHIIDNPEKAYWLGFIAADGCNYIREGNASVIINLHQKDREHLEKFKKFMNSTANIVDYVTSVGYSNNTPMCKIVINSKELAQDLNTIGITPRKSLTLQPPQIPEQFYKAFILGYFDGDGSIFKSSQYNNYFISIEGTKEILTWINQVLNINLKLEKRYDDERNNYYIRCGGTNKPYSVLNQLYNSCETHLDRKYEIYQALETVVLGSNTK